jgi:putative tricarboxylic transport membrane protein
MGSLASLMYGFSIALTPENILASLVGTTVGTFVGVLPGLGPVGAIAMLLPTTLALRPETSLIMLAGIYYGSMYGGSTTSILVNVPGEVASVVTCIDGFQMAKKGKAGIALAVAAIGSFIAGTLGVIGLMLFAPPLANLALTFGPPEYFAIGILGLLTLSRLSGGSLWKSLLTLTFGLAIATVGMDPVSGVPRYTFGIVELSQGIELVPVIMGLYGVAEVLSVAEKAEGLPQLTEIKFRDLFPKRSDWKRALPAWLRGSVVGFFVGLIPGPATVIATFASYKMERSLSKKPDEFGHGAIEGLAGPEAANNAASCGAMVPLLSLGIPFAPVPAILLAALMIQGIQPGPLLIEQHPAVFWGVIASMYIGNIALLILNLPLVGMWVSVLRIRQPILLASIMTFMIGGAYSVNNSILDLEVMLGSGFVGYILRKVDFDLAPMVLAIVIGPMIEKALRQSLYISQGDPFVFFTRPISIFIFAILMGILFIPPIRHFIARRRKTL